MRLGGAPIEAGKKYKVAGWAPVAEGARGPGEPVWEALERYLKDRKVVAPRAPYVPKLVGIAGNPGYA
jgi:sulfur-oxidizing protein SoxB